MSPCHRGGSHEATTSEMPLMCLGVSIKFPFTFPPPLMTEPSSVLYMLRCPLGVFLSPYAGRIRRRGKPTVLGDPGSYGTPHGQQHTLPHSINKIRPCMGSPLDPKRGHTPRANSLRWGPGGGHAMLWGPAERPCVSYIVIHMAVRVGVDRDPHARLWHHFASLLFFSTILRGSLPLDLSSVSLTV